MWRVRRAIAAGSLVVFEAFGFLICVFLAIGLRLMGQFRGSAAVEETKQADLPQDVATDEVRKASQSRASDSPVPGEHRDV